MSLARWFGLTIGFALFLTGQPSAKEWASADEYEVGSRAFAQPDPRQKLTLLQEWVTRFPVTQFERERMLSFALAFYQTGDSRESLRRATQVLSLYPADPGILLMISAVGPGINAPSDQEIATVAASAASLLTFLATPKPTPVAVTPQPEPAIPVTTTDPESERVLVFVRRLRSAQSTMSAHDPEALKRQVAEAALEWVKKHKR